MSARLLVAHLLGAKSNLFVYDSLDQRSFRGFLNRLPAIRMDRSLGSGDRAIRVLCPLFRDCGSACRRLPSWLLRVAAARWDFALYETQHDCAEKVADHGNEGIGRTCVETATVATPRLGTEDYEDEAHYCANHDGYHRDRRPEALPMAAAAANTEPQHEHHARRQQGATCGENPGDDKFPRHPEVQVASTEVGGIEVLKIEVLGIEAWIHEETLPIRALKPVKAHT